MSVAMITIAEGLMGGRIAQAKAGEIDWKNIKI